MTVDEVRALLREQMPAEVSVRVDVDRPGPGFVTLLGRTPDFVVSGAVTTGQLTTDRRYVERVVSKMRRSVDRRLAE